MINDCFRSVHKRGKVNEEELPIVGKDHLLCYIGNCQYTLFYFFVDYGNAPYTLLGRTGSQHCFAKMK